MRFTSRTLTASEWWALSVERREVAAAWLDRHGIDFRDCNMYAEVEPGRFRIWTWSRPGVGVPPELHSVDVVDDVAPPFVPDVAP